MAKITPMKAIRKKCLECSAGQPAEVKHCPIEKCPLYVYRFGHRPTEAVESTAEETEE